MDNIKLVLTHPKFIQLSVVFVFILIGVCAAAYFVDKAVEGVE